MRFYDRTNELAELQRIKNLSFNDHSRLTVVTGRRRIGKTSLIMRSIEDSPTVYLFVGRKNEATLCAEFIPVIAQSLETFVPNEIRTFRSLFQYLMELSVSRAFNLVIDEFQEFYNINESVYSDMQNLWDQYRKKSRMNLIVSGSIYSLMQKIFQNSKEPLFGRADNIIKLSAFSLTTLKEIIHDHRPDYSNDDLLALYAFTGGVPKYVELFCDNGALSVDEMINFMIRENSPFTDEGKNLLVEEFGKNYATYFSILSAISGGINTQPEIEAALGNKSIGGQIKRLIEDYNIIVRKRPILAKEGSQTVRYEIQDNFIRFWFNYFDRHRSLIEIKNFVGLQAIIKADYPTYSGKMLEEYFKQKFAESFQYRAIGSWWDTRNGQDEIDIVALKLEKKQAVVAEVKRQKKNFKPELLAAKVEHLKRKLLPKYQIEMVCLSLESM
ncbi:ATP-binding protein [Bacteroides cellulosilyticus]|jgi:AAA+ ATPase superfamily predicted ATPase|uniref:ATP-binding protein n=1 Tax=Bacteroides cellulosilyticus TaxID=246787 RepID=UPI001C37876C|nr:ATP-binding protein [Bacteroides cellulosilyticus]MBD8983382.1 ATP-binding protein [Bacteroides cellulosilyticus]MBV3639134.1 ATP-binding protein [Bacteroides cellulosilyticus]MBV3665219.1 ATP-binding protein [Bacteroides cellulosilyticus]MBV3687182.1 ATP-binding protein [Bacteroides cellulosilyticus]MBV3695973.1 ATP-binding protein [Bacteroides cellulosilyticus]